MRLIDADELITEIENSRKTILIKIAMLRETMT